MSDATPLPGSPSGRPDGTLPGPSGAPEGAAAGQPRTPQPTGVDLARVALRAAREQARARGEQARERKQARRGGGLRSGARADGRDPMPLGSAIHRLIDERGWETPAAVGGVMGRWPQIVGEAIALHCTPERFDEEARELTVRCDSTTWATEMRLRAPQLVARINQDLGHGSIHRIKVTGPGGPARRFGPLRAPGSTGPGDTYG
ncbi:DUF721 domain-containing protein [Streptomyces sp. J2-1]|uniref:DUF721 domain-containing protein n=1 Tax=Streptomyces corallincola TaxID=2851888 RepID=UPI001C392C81|nr:DciA family protein [Streptomyces corallincola]MBV2354850.1 DUF721 domain-containing protein [Streptomyces corallincola]